MDKGTYVYCTTQFIGFHQWKDAPDSFAYLRNKHRHVFHVKVVVEVSHVDRDVEFHYLKVKVDDAIGNQYRKWKEEASCEEMAVDIGSWLRNNPVLGTSFDVQSVEVSEDGENGAIVVW